jgi:PAT family beta-lactamase induction signal transducer AmpG
MLIERLGFVNFYLLTTVIAFPGIVVFWLMVRTGYLESSLGTVVTATANRGRGTQV